MVLKRCLAKEDMNAQLAVSPGGVVGADFGAQAAESFHNCREV